MAENQLGIVWCGRGDVDQALLHLEKASQAYEVQKQDRELYEGKGQAASSTASEEAYTLTLYYKAQAYGNCEPPRRTDSAR